MSKSKFNLKNYEKIDGDILIGSRLMGEHKDAPNEVTEKQLDRDRIPEKEVTIEKLLEKNRTGGANVLTEGRLNTEKTGLGLYRNPSAFKGNINKVEELRLSGDPVENEKYTDASETPKGLRWWEKGGKSPDGLKLANTKKTTKTAQIADIKDDEVDELNFSEKNEWENLSKEYFDEDTVENYPTIPIPIDDFDIVEDSGQSMEIIKSSDLSGPVNGVYILLKYDPEDFYGDEEAIREAAFSKVISFKPELEDKIEPDDFSDIKEVGGEGTIAIRAIGDFSSSGSKDSEGVFELLDFDERDIGGTSVVTGIVEVTGPIDEENTIKDVLEYLNDQQPDLNITEESLDLSKINDGIIGFLVSPPQPPDIIDASSNFKIIEAQSNIKKN